MANEALQYLWGKARAGGVNVGDYLMGGAMFTTGFSMPGEGYRNPAGQEVYRFGQKAFTRRSGDFGPPFTPLKDTSAIKVLSGKGGTIGWDEAVKDGWLARQAGKLPVGAKFAQNMARHAGPLFGMGMSGYFMMKGYQGELGPRSGVAGAWDSAVMDVSSMAAMRKFSTVSKVNSAGVMVARGAFGGGVGGFLKTGALGIGAFTGAGIGQSLAGTPGAIAGGYLGGALTAGAVANPLLAAGAAATIGGAYLVGKGAYSLLKTGYRKKQYSKRIDTAGDMSAFMTSGARTMRERSVQAMRSSHMNARSALGQESSFLHMNRNYFSTYRQF